jgi:hypothetical protein
VLFSIYIGDISSVLNKHSVRYVLYADDFQIFAPSTVANINSTIVTLEKCLCDIQDWLTLHCLILNPSKTELILFAGKSKLQSTLGIRIRVGDVDIISSPVVRNLGCLLDSSLTMEKHISAVCKSSFSYLRLISKIRKYLNVKNALLLVNALAISRINYCSSIFIGVSKKQLAKLDRIQRYGIRLVEKLRKTDGVTQALQHHEWLTVIERAEKRLLNIALTAVCKGVPIGLASFLTVHAPSQRPLRSHSRGQLVVPRSNSAYGDRAFSITAPKMINSLPVDIRLPAITALSESRS